MTTQGEVDRVLAAKEIAVIGASRGGKKFGNTIVRELQAKGYSVHPVHPEAESIEGRPCVPTLRDVPESVETAVFSVPSEVTETLLPEAADTGIRNVWLQQGSQSERAVALCKEHDMTCVSGECILMYVEPVTSIHGFHRWVWKILRRLPTE